MTLARITLRLARNPGTEFVNGDDRYGYTFVAPLDDYGYLDEHGWHAHRADCTVRHVTPDLPAPREGMLKRRGSNWYFDYDAHKTDDDEPIFKLDRHSFRKGEYVTVTDENNHPLAYLVTNVATV